MEDGMEEFVVVVMFQMNLLTIQLLLSLLLGGNDSPKLKYSFTDKIPKQISYLRGLVSDMNNSSIDQMRMSRDAFGRLCVLLYDFAGLRDSKYVSLTEKVCMFLRILAHHEKTRSQKYEFKRSTWTISHHFKIVLCGVLSLHDRLLIKPVPLTPANARNRFKFFENCLGALDGSYFPARVPAADRARHRNRKGQISFNTLGVCDQNMNFIYLLTGWEGSTSDSRVLKNAITRDNMKLCLLRGQYYLADNGYMNCEGFLTPYRNVRYHLKEWGT